MGSKRFEGALDLWVSTLKRFLGYDAQRQGGESLRGALDRQEIEELLLKARAVDASANGVVITGAPEAGSPIVYFNDAVERITGYSQHEVLGRNPRFLQGPYGDQAEIAGLRRAIEEGQEFFGVVRNQKKDGTTFWNEMYVAPVRDDDNFITHFIGVQNDVTERWQLEERLKHQAFHDPLTDLPNRALFVDRLEHALGREDGAVAVLFIDLDGFKHVNDSLGHGAGDELLVAVAERLERCLSPEDTVARLGGDEFVVILEVGAAGESGTEAVNVVQSEADAKLVAGSGAEPTAVRAAERVIDALGTPFCLGEASRAVFAAPSIGVTLGGSVRDAGSAASKADTRREKFPGAEGILRQADLAMYQAKKQANRGEERYALYQRWMGEKAAERLGLESDLGRAVERGEFEVHYQPNVELGTGNVVGHEALVRWRRLGEELVLPGAFIPLAEETGMIVNIGRQVLEQACAQARRWRDLQRQQQNRTSPLTVWVNLSARQLREADLVGEVSAVLGATGLEPEDLGFEVTESILLADDASGIVRLRELKALGVRLAIDDFGTGYSSLSYLKQLPVDILKIDRSFVAGLGGSGASATDERDATIVSTVVALARAMGLAALAEGVETEEQLARLEALGCDLAQGYLFSRPLPAAKIRMPPTVGP